MSRCLHLTLTLLVLLTLFVFFRLGSALETTPPGKPEGASFGENAQDLLSRTGEVRKPSLETLRDAAQWLETSGEKEKAARVRERIAWEYPSR